MTEQLPGDDDDAQQLSEPERQFRRRWQELVEQAGGRKVVASRVAGSARATVYRDYAGTSLPTAQRLRQLCGFLGLQDAERDELLTMLERAQAARQARRQGAGGTPSSAGTGPGTSAGTMDAEGGPRGPVAQGGRPAGPRPLLRCGARAVAALAAGAAAAVTAAGVLVWWQPWRGPARPADAPAAAGGDSGLVARGDYPGLGLKAVSVPVSSLTPALAEALRRSGAARGPVIAGYAFRNMEDPGLCLAAAESGPAAGQNRGRVDIESCDYGPGQVWIPLQWEAGGSRFTQLVSLRYQSRCLNADNIGGLADGHRTQLWNCYQSPNEYWDFGDWYQHVRDRRAYPVFVESARFCLDADKYDFGAGDRVNIWTQYPAANQFWS